MTEEAVTHAVRGADRADRHRQRARRSLRAGAPRGVRVVTAGAPPAAATIERIEGELGWDDHPGLRPDRDRAVHHRLRAAARARDAAAARSQRAAIKARQGVELITSGELRVVDERRQRGAARRRRRSARSSCAATSS